MVLMVQNLAYFEAHKKIVLYIQTLLAILYEDNLYGNRDAKSGIF